ncbi:MAG: hypothetical protein KAX49_14020 [Halanaerobiales bacterium]|nr:hypothetical protein [Halanaerobiales bacterium]
MRNTSIFKVVKGKEKIGEFRLLHNLNLTIYIDYKEGGIKNKGDSSDFFRLLSLYRENETSNLIENLDIGTEQTLELLKNGRFQF